MTRLTLICARATNGVIGREGALPWHIPADLKRFKALTLGPAGTGKPMIMGRRTFDSLGKVLPGRRHIVLTRDAHWRAAGAEPVPTIADALASAGDEASVIGGAEIFEAFLTRAARFELTEVHAEVAGDTFLPPIGPEWREIAREEHAAKPPHPAFAFVTLIRDLWPASA